MLILEYCSQLGPEFLCLSAHYFSSLPSFFDEQFLEILLTCDLLFAYFLALFDLAIFFITTVWFSFRLEFQLEHAVVQEV